MGFLDDIDRITVTTKNAGGYILKVKCQIYPSYFTCGYCKASQVNKVAYCHNCHGVFEYFDKIKVGGSYSTILNREISLSS